jgi:hypothetical protein
VSGPKSQPFSGRAVDGLGRPVSGVTVSLLAGSRIVVRTGDDGRFSGILSSGREDCVITFSNDRYGRYSTGGSPNREFVLRHRFDWGKAPLLPFEEGDKLDRDVRELLASEDWFADAEKLLGLIFKHQVDLRPVLRRLIGDARVGPKARDWLELLDDPADRDVFPRGRRYAPDKVVKETDLVEALQETARLKNISLTPQPTIDIDFIAFTPGLDRALIQCGINRVALTGITWQFIFRKVGKQWELRSAKEVGCS